MNAKEIIDLLQEARALGVWKLLIPGTVEIEFFDPPPPPPRVALSAPTPPAAFRDPPQGLAELAARDQAKYAVGRPPPPTCLVTPELAQAARRMK